MNHFTMKTFRNRTFFIPIKNKQNIKLLGLAILAIGIYVLADPQLSQIKNIVTDITVLARMLT